MTVRDALVEQKRELDLRRQELYIERTAEIHEDNSRLIRMVIGPRRAGKSFFVTRHLMAKGPFGYVNFDDERLKQNRTNGSDYFDELLDRIRDIRASEKWFYRKIPGTYSKTDRCHRKNIIQNFIYFFVL